VVEPAFLLDSNICIYVLRDADSAAAIKLGKCAPGSVVTSSIVYAELLRGAPRDLDSRAGIDALFTLVPVLPFDDGAARAYRDIPFKRGTFDRLIAAHALSLGLTLVTGNVRDYSDVSALRIENWAKP
jgi:tRNA(fMet)-specific endonuclease VapC